MAKRYGPNTPFKPPVYKPKPDPMWATFIGDRNPQWKIHNGRGQAISACKYHKARGGVIYQLVDNEWLEYDRYEGTGTQYALKPGECAECGGQVWEDDYLCTRCRVDKDG